MHPRFLIDENLSPVLASHLVNALGFDAVHVNATGLRAAPAPDVLAFAVAENRIVMTSNGDDFRKLVRGVSDHPGLAIMRNASGRQRQIELWSIGDFMAR